MLSDQELQSLRNWGNLAEEAADEICALRAALAAQPAEPVAVMWLYPDGRRYTMTWVGQDEDRMQEMIAERGLIRRELYAAPPAPVPLTDKCATLMRFYRVDTADELIVAQARHIEKLQEKLPHEAVFSTTRVREG